MAKLVESTGKKYPAQTFNGSYHYCDVFPADKKLKVPVNCICFDYPWRQAVYVRTCETWGELMKKFYTHFRKFYKKDWKEHGDDAIAWHYLGDYIVELVEIYADGTAVAYIGS